MIPTNTNVKLVVKSGRPAAGGWGDVEAVGMLIGEGAKVVDGSPPQEAGRAAERLIRAGIVRGKTREVVSDLVEVGGKLRRVYVAGLGPPGKVTAETVRQAAGGLARAARGDRVGSLAIVGPRLPKVAVSEAEAVRAAVEGFVLASFRYREYVGTVGKKKEAEENVGRVTLTVLSDDAEARSAADRGRVVADAQNFARTVASRPGNNINPVSLVQVAQELARESGLGLRVLDEKQMRRRGMGGLLGVGGGSRTPPRIIVLEHRGQATKRRSDAATKGRTAAQAAPLLVVGKTITFDTGGISIKPSEKMQKMIYDKCGGMAVLGLMYAAARLKLPQRVVGILSCAENHVSADSYRPGDILRMYNGVTVEVTNTDAEGRLVLGDALAWGIEEYKPSAVVNLATLTGGIIIALGKTTAGLMGNDDALAGEVAAAADGAGEKVWRMPLFEEHREQLSSDLADLINAAGREASSLTAGAFLSHFVPEGTPWAHLDIAGVADTEKDLPYYGKGATGWGVRTLVEWVDRRGTRF